VNRNIPIHKTPKEKAFGILGETLGSDNGIGYIKKEFDSRNIGWENAEPAQPIEPSVST
jgi:hypothetical protein